MSRIASFSTAELHGGRVLGRHSSRYGVCCAINGDFVAFCGLNVENSSLAMVFISATLFAFMGAMVKLAADRGISPYEMVLMRAVWQGFFVALALVYFKIEYWLGKGEVRRWVILRGMLGGTMFCLDFVTLTLLEFGDATALTALSPFVAVFLSRLMLGERLTITKVLAVLLSIVGAVMIIQPPFLFGTKRQGWLGVITGLSSSVVGGLIFVVVRRAKEAMALQLLWSFSVFSLLIAGVLSFTLSWITVPTRDATWILFGLCAFGIVGHFAFNYAVRLAPAGPSSLVSSSEIVMGYLLQVFFFKQPVTLVTMCGVSLTVIAISMIALGDMRTVARENIALPSDKDQETAEEKEPFIAESFTEDFKA
mmetsp:Transcript_24027/g.36033  ORF Transcript_24027/g.36033 Transcript_24027/m.36033 type:complete len:366 (-) Transcript_24027:178-1275(-)|eukprot:CAMPEP_0167764222 /NCGR_PEP_ID=MMETSP0110_2-20121227/13886_1 /TAXON_ID=629695 /ORGANISM="Gymnochlora sp., Strain CCMP2014" /LENGTH=365 /DNA_ID=CAMNT_0007651549 /DNA_START=86 /DNA_END=1183 /DNA_ORIENTATION=-